MIVLLLLNFVISCFNAIATGYAWTESKMVGGWVHFMTWMGAIMSACGFTWCYLVMALTLAGDSWDPGALEAAASLGYLVIVFPILGSGLAITIQSWIHFARERNWSSGLTAGWNTFAQIHNAYGAVQGVPKAWKTVKEYVSSKDDNAVGRIIMLVALVVVGGALTTALIVRIVAMYRAEAIREEARRTLG